MSVSKILLLYPPISKHERYSSSLGNAGGRQIPLGIFYIASYLRANGCDVVVRDAEAEYLTAEDIVREVGELKPAIIGISSTTVAFHRAVETARRIKREYALVPVILGGAHVSANPLHAINFDCFDYGVLREGEITALELVNAIVNAAPTESIKGIAYKRDGRIVVTPQREYLPDLDALPFPAYDLIRDLRRYAPPPCNYKAVPAVNIITSRGCPNRCTFCDRNVFGERYRERSAANVAGEIEYLVAKHHVRELAFVDDTFLINKKRIRELFDLLDARGITLPWTCMSRINNVDEDFLRYIKSKGCWHISFGIESGDEGILARIRKNVSLANAGEVIGCCRRLKIKTKGFFIVGHPGETIETIEKSMKLACDLPLDDIVVTINTPIPGSVQYEEARRYGTLDTADWSKFNYWNPVFVPKGLTKAILTGKHRKFYRRFYLRPKIIGRYLMSIFGRGGLTRFTSLARASVFLVGKEASHVK
jgi:anaerobic magnesium-protoporphyrin IX monomethyl ester cyclase